MDISFQLYSARDAGDWVATYAHLAEVGYTQVEGFGGVYEDAGKTRAQLDEVGLKMVSGHVFPITTFETDFDATIQTARTLGIERLFVPAPEDLWRDGTDADNWIALAKRIADVGKAVSDAGLRFGWHNHHWEFMALETGEIPMQLILDHAPEVEWEMDVAWVVRGGGNPLEWITNYKDRITSAHVKDIAPEGECEDEDGWADVGHGTMDWKSLTGALRDAGVDLFVMEHDKPSDARRFASRSIASFKTY